MYEIAGARQPRIPSESQGYRRLFASEDFTLHVWYDREGGEITAFDIFYGPTRNRRLSWNAADNTTRAGTVTEHGFWGRDGVVLPAEFNARLFHEQAEDIDRDVRDFVLERLTR
jgi:hypothetical protein